MEGGAERESGEWGVGADNRSKDSEKEGGQREKQGLSQVVHSAKQVLDKHIKSKRSQSTVNVARQKTNKCGQIRITLVSVPVCTRVCTRAKLISGRILSYQ